MNRTAGRSMMQKYINFSALALSLMLFQNCGNFRSNTSENNQSTLLNDGDPNFSADSLSPMSSVQNGIQPASGANSSTVNTNAAAGITETKTCYQYSPNYYNVREKCEVKKSFPILTLNAKVIAFPAYTPEITSTVTSTVPVNIYLSTSARVGIVGYQNSVNCGLNRFRLNQNHTLSNLNCIQYSLEYKLFGDPKTYERLGRRVCEITPASQCQ